MLKLKLDDWQKDVIKDILNGKNIALRAGRQVGKSECVSRAAGRLAVDNKNYSIMVISATERQAYLLFSKILHYLDDNYRNLIKMGKDRPTKSEIKLKNGSIIRCLPTGLDGLGIRGYTIHTLIADEAAFIPPAVYPAVTPALSTTGGQIVLLSTPFGKQGYFFERYSDPNFKTYHINAEVVAENRDEPQRTNMKMHQEQEKRVMSRLEYAQEYLGHFVDEMRQLFPDELIRSICIGKRRAFNKDSRYFLGVDIARMGDDESTFEIIEKADKDFYVHVENIVTTKTLTTETHDRILELDKQWKFREIGIDAGSGSLGVGIYDWLLRESKVMNKLTALTNQSRILDPYGQSKKNLLKEDMYMNLLALMQRRAIRLLDDDQVIASLRSVQYEHIIKKDEFSKTRIFGKYTHIAEGLIRAAWLATQSKSLNLWAASISNANIKH